jgi:PTH1 family peptidyl-tRNA hydrolase
VGLGNPGLDYKNTRHNIGFMVIGSWAKRLGVRLSGRRFQSRNGAAKWEGREAILLCPQTFMNRSGHSIKACLDFYRLKTEQLIVVHDDIDLPVGKIRVVKNGGSGGHKGVLSMIDHLGTHDFARIKVGIGRPQYGEAIETYVLSPFYEEEREIMERVIQAAVRACELILTDGMASAMNRVNRQNLAENKEEID